jgi:hypothetical protein
VRLAETQANAELQGVLIALPVVRSPEGDEAEARAQSIGCRGRSAPTQNQSYKIDIAAKQLQYPNGELSNERRCREVPNRRNPYCTRKPNGLNAIL